MKTAVIAALPRELKGLVDGWARVPVSRPDVVLYERGEMVAACAGMGVERAALAVEAVLARAGDVGELISYGLAGACDPALPAGEVMWCGAVVDARSGERYRTVDAGGVLVTAATVAGVAEKRRLRESYGAAMVDMEAAAVGRLAQAHGLRFRALKAVSDGAEDGMEGFDRFVTRTGQFREGAFGLYLAVRPARWRAAMALGRASAQGLRAAAAELARGMKADEERGEG